MKNHMMGGSTQGRVKVRRVFRGDRGLEGRSILVEGLGSSKVSLNLKTLYLYLIEIYFLCTGAFLYVPYSFLLITNKFCV